MAAAALVGGAFLSASLQVLFDRLASPEILNLIQAKRLNKNLLDRLQTTLYAASAVLNDAENRQIKNKAVKSWLDDLRDAVYHAEDLFDEISTNAATRKEVPNFFSSLLNLHYRELGNKIEDITQRIESVVRYKDVLGLREKEQENLSWRPQTTSLVKESDVYGRDKDKDSVIKFLLDDKKENTLSVIPIVGMGGIGKTTLAQLVYNDDKVKGEFDLRVWVYVSEEFDILKVTKTILQAINPNGCNREDLDSLQLELKESLCGRKFLIVLDDVWNEDYIYWNHLQSPFLYGKKGSKILLTTRSQKVASVVQTTPTHTYDVGLLSDEDSWLLFTKHAFLSTDRDVNSNLEKIGRDIVKKCKGLPLAVKALGGLLRSKRDIMYWNLILSSDIWDLPEDESKIFPALRISYQYVPSRLKQCFAYCSLFPKGYEFDKEGLILLWMAEGFLRPLNKEMDLEEVGSVSFDDLISRSFFQQSIRYDGYFIMHDLMHDLATFIAGDFYHRLEAGNDTKISKRTRHLSYDACHGTLEDIEALCHVESGSLRTLVIDCFSYNNKLRAAHVDRLLSKFKRLRILSLPGFWDEVLPDSICQLKHLRYLNLTWSKIKRLPESIGNLYNLQTLKLRHARHLCMLPNSVQHLVNLRHLDIDVYRMELPKGIHKLQNLHYLPIFNVSKAEGAKIGELGGLSNIGKRLQIRFMEDVSSSMEALEARMRDKKNIKHLELYWSLDADDAADSEGERDILNKLLPHSNLKILWVTGYRGTRFSDWLEHPWHHNILDLSLLMCRNCCMLPPLGQLPSLRKLTIGGLDALVTLGVEFHKTNYSSSITPFASLEYLEFFDMPAWKEWCLTEMEAFPKLRDLIINGCPQLARCMIQCPALETLDIVDCPVLVECCIPISVKELVISHCDRLEFPKHQCFKSLESLDISYSCGLLTSFLTNTFPNLKQLGITGTYEGLQCFPGDGLLPTSLSSICLRELSSLERLDWKAFRHLTSLQQLTIEDCPKVEKMAVEAEELQHVSNVKVSKKLSSADRATMLTIRRKPRKDIVSYESIRSYPMQIIFGSRFTQF